ncbi:hypothetical protein ABLE91_10390 [Aquabacter sp. CN5-332]|uniref:hypothetical protein n=1 Tax=Aquabacter sp. CN5-332 TaxID=3156608 RepID=UPI0032B47350
MDSSTPARERMHTGSEARRETSAAPPDHIHLLEMMEREEGRHASVADQPSWQLWGMMVGFMAAGAAILAILSVSAA